MYQVAKYQPSKKTTKRRRKLRSLMIQKTDSTHSKSISNLVIYTILLSLGILIGLFYNEIIKTAIWNDFRTTYRNQFNLIVHGEIDYCLPIMDTGKMFSQIRNDVLNQQEALSILEAELQNQTKFISLAIAGPSGVGKSLFAQALSAKFPWQENIQMYTWYSGEKENTVNIDLSSMLDNLSECGRNLIIIDNLEPDNVNFTEDYNKKSLNKIHQSTVNLVIIYIFNLLTYTHDQQIIYKENLNSIQNVENLTLVEFKNIGAEELNECIRHESKNLNLTLDEEDFKEVLKSIDPTRSGCKNVYSKVLMYGKIKDK